MDNMEEQPRQLYDTKSRYLLPGYTPTFSSITAGLGFMSGLTFREAGIWEIVAHRPYSTFTNHAAIFSGYQVIPAEFSAMRNTATLVRISADRTRGIVKMIPFNAMKSYINDPAIGNVLTFEVDDIGSVLVIFELFHPKPLNGFLAEEVARRRRSQIYHDDLRMVILEKATEVDAQIDLENCVLETFRNREAVANFFFPRLQPTTVSEIQGWVTGADQSQQPVKVPTKTMLVIREQLVRYKSMLLRRLVAAAIGEDLPKFTVIQLIAFALLAYDRRTASECEIIRWLRERFPYLQTNLIWGVDGRSRIGEHVRGVLKRNQASSYPLFELVDQSTCGLTRTNIYSKVWRLEEMNINYIFEEMYTPDVVPFWRHHKEFSRAQYLPLEISRKIFDFALSAGQTFMVKNNVTRTSVLEWKNWEEKLEEETSRPWYDKHPLDLHTLVGYGDDIRVGEYFLGSVLRGNTFALRDRKRRKGKTGTFSDPHGPKLWLKSLGEKGRFYLRSVDVIIEVDSTSAKTVMRALKKMLTLLGTARLVELKLQINIPEEDTLRNNWSNLQMFRILATYRNFKNGNLVLKFEPPWPEAEEYLRNRMTRSVLGGGNLPIIAQRPARRLDIMTWPRWKRQAYVHASGMKVGTSQSRPKSPGYKRAEAALIGAYMRRVYNSARKSWRS
ncbi:hypothetical protein P280DRAFT_547657 [Massarina eburnea CBS 473.64]|uniref:Uncharacterized protein n=1 Tax=Massarina eburnea CBS 473.64 TaxID=1395130 RepID=A0A6A6S6Z0_9PLEO|nr:hypothetical protein P280DRAFT_547657 [Massarina eburnea CBS 473.64]